jgi:cyclopropane-fatty-acyl-phospholipid synthase
MDRAMQTAQNKVSTSVPEGNPQAESTSVSIINTERLERSPHFPPVTEAPRSIEGKLIRNLLALFGNPRVQIMLSTGEVVGSTEVPAVVRVRVADRATLVKLCADPDMQFGEAYSAGKLEVEGDFQSLLEDIYRGAAGRKAATSLTRRLTQKLHRRRANSMEASRENIHHHYDISNDFYSLWLGSTMAYTCAYYPTPDATLEQAQIAKMDHVCRKVGLKPGERVVEAGCGWGGLALHMAKHYGVKVHAFNISRQQLAFARERAQRMGLSKEVEFVEDDYRNIKGDYDVFMSIGMLEHVGVENYPELGQVIDRSIHANGRGLLHTIGRNQARPMHRWIERRIFPGAEPPSLKQMMDIFEGANLSVLDVENIRLHYAQTLQHWYELYEASVERIAQMFDEKFVRMWRLYLLGSKAAFMTGDLQLFQVAFARGRSNQIPWTRAEIYQR